MFNFFHLSDRNLVKSRYWQALLAAFGGGVLYALALPPFNWEFLAYFTLVPLVFTAVRATSVWRAALLGWVWSLGWTIFSFQFLREIEPVVPYLLAPVLSLWGAVFGACLPGLWRYLILPPAVLNGGYTAECELFDRGVNFWNLLLFCVTAAALFCTLELTRYHLFTWNDLSVTQYKNLPLLQLTRYTGSYGVNFVVALVNLAIFALLLRRGYRVTAVLGGIFLVVYVGGFWSLKNLTPPSSMTFSPVLIQGDLSQRRRPSINQVFEAFEIYFKLSAEAAQVRPELIIWPESAIPVSYNGTGGLSKIYRRSLRKFQLQTGIPMLIGALDYTEQLPGAAGEPGVTNSALLLDKAGRVQSKYDKFHRVPYGEYIPFRRFLPKFFTRMIDMGRDLTPGKSLQPMTLRPGIHAGVAICYEGVFSYLTREFARRGANVLIVLSNDAWYPHSSEPEQHLANAVIRAVETGLPMIRCGNNGGSGVVTPCGRFEQIVEVPGAEIPALRRGRGWRQIQVPLNEVNPTFFVRHGWWPLLALLGLILVTGGSCAVKNYWKFHRQFVR